ncbi:MAG: acyl-CoA thioesterase [Flavobacteriales bacterium]
MSTKKSYFSVDFRVLYADTDQMGIMYHGAYVKYLEMARTELLRACDMTYKSIEDSGLMSPILNLNIKYIKPCKYDQIIEIRTWVSDLKGSRLMFDYELFIENKLTTIAQTTLAFLDMKTGRPQRINTTFKTKLNPYTYEPKTD